MIQMFFIQGDIKMILLDEDLVQLINDLVIELKMLLDNNS